MKKVLLIYPNEPVIATRPPLGLMYIAAALRARGHQPMIIEGNARAVIQQFQARQLYRDVDFIGITGMSSMYKEILKMRDYFHLMNIPLVFGGVHATILPQSFLTEEEHLVDYVVQGEGEKTMVKIVEGEIQAKADVILQGETIQDLDELPFPARDLVKRRYHKHSVSMLASRGCPFNCSFCQPTLRKVFGSRVRRRSVENVINEMWDCFNKFRIHDFEFYDDTFTADKNWVYQFCTRMNTLSGALGDWSSFTWKAISRVDMLDYDLLKTMKEAGLTKLSLGLESGSQEILNSYSKGTRVEQNYGAVEMCRKLGIKVHGFFMLGALDETRESMEQTKQLARAPGIDTMFVAITTPMPETRLYEQAKKEGRLLADWKEFDILGNLTTTGSQAENNPVPMKLKYLSPEDVINARKQILREFYFRKMRNPIYLFRYLQEHGWAYTWDAGKKLLRRSA
jgi:anaerobic magnesium-protoporphyrin IX monomethyl ester cyclase